MLCRIELNLKCFEMLVVNNSAKYEALRKAKLPKPSFHHAGPIIQTLQVLEKRASPSNRETGDITVAIGGAPSTQQHQLRSRGTGEPLRYWQHGGRSLRTEMPWGVRC